MLDQYTSADSAPYQEWRSPEVTPTQNPQSPTQLNSLSHNNNSRVVNQPKQPEFQRGQSRTIYLPAERTGAVIGKNGRMKHLIKEVCNVWMSIKSEPFELDNTKRVCVIRGPTTDNLDHAESLINELLRDRETIEKSIALNTSDDVGRVIGSGGSNIQVIKDKTGAFVYVDKENVPTQYAGRCIIRGNSVQVQAAEKRVLELLARRDLNILEQCIAAHTNASFAKQMSAQPKMNQSTSPTQHQMMSHSYDRFQTSDKNGFGMFNSSANSHGYHGMNENDQKTSIDQSQNGTQILQWNNPQTDQWATQKENEKEMEKHAKKRIQDTILIPLQAVGMVIGKKGKNIKIIQETSGANVYIDKEYTGHDDNALCVIHGKMEQVDIAKEMIHEKLQQYNSANTFPIDNFGTQLDSPPSDTRSDGSTGIQGSAYSSPPTHGSNNRIELNFRFE